MPITLQAWPFENIDTTEQQYGRLFHLLQDDGLAVAPTSTAGLVTAGTGFTVNVAAIDLAYAAGVAAMLPTAGTITLDSAGTQARVDRIVLRINSTTNTAVIDDLTGTPGATTPPGLTQTFGGIYEIPIARITVPSNALNIAATNITDERTFISQRVLQYATASRPTGTKGNLGFNYTTGRPEYHDGGTWIDYTRSVESQGWAPGFGGTDATRGDNGGSDGQVAKNGKSVTYNGRIVFGSNASFGTGTAAVVGLNTYGDLNVSLSQGYGWYERTNGSRARVRLIPATGSQCSILVERGDDLVPLFALGTPARSDQLHLVVNGVLA